MPPDAKEWLPLHEVERRHILTVVEACGGNRADAARVLGIDPTTLAARLRRYGVAQGTLVLALPNPPELEG